MPLATLPRIRRRAQLVAVGVIVALAGMGAVSAQAASATWSPPVAVTTDEGSAVATVTAPDGTITSVVDSNTTGIMAVSSMDGGASWQLPVSLGSGGDASFRPTIGMTSTGLLAIAWVESTSDVLDPNVTISSIQIVISSDGGSTWSAKTPLPTVSADVDDPAIGSSSPLGFTVVWAEGFAKLSSSTANSTAVGGATWSDPTVITEDRNSTGTTSLVALGTSDILAVFHELDGVTSQFSIQSRRSTDGGLTWAPAVMVAPAWNGLLGNSNYTIASTPVPGSIVVFWNHQREGGGEALFAATSTDRDRAGARSLRSHSTRNS